MRKHPSSILCLALLLAGFGLQAQEPGVFTKDFKLRTGYGLVSEDKLNPASLSLGFNVAYGLEAGKVGLELGYFYKSGDQFIKPVQGDAPSTLSPVDLTRSGDSRRNTIEGLYVRLSFQRNFDEDWSWQAGVMLGGTRFKHEYVGDVEGQNWTVANTTSWRDFYYGTPTSSGIKVSPYVGTAVKIGDHSSLEMNLVLLSYTALDYNHLPGTASSYAQDTNPYSDSTVGRLSPDNGFPQDTLVKTNRLVPTLELGYIFHF